MAAHHAKAIAGVDGMRITSCASRDRGRALAFAAAHGIAHVQTLDEALAHAEADAFWLCVSADAMADTAARFALLGLPMFLEKPVGLDAAETAAIRDRISAPHMVGLNRRFYEVIRRGGDLITAAGGLRAIEIHMPEDVAAVPSKHGARSRRQWQFANSVHLIDLFRFFAGEPAEIVTMNEVRDSADRSYNALIRFETGARGVYNAQWYAPGGWRVALYADDLSIVYQPIEAGEMRRRGAAPVPLLPEGPDLRFKAGLWAQAAAFRDLVATGRAVDGAPDLAEYARSVALVDRLTAQA
jgi:predicted dehydrogenase